MPEYKQPRFHLILLHEAEDFVSNQNRKTMEKIVSDIEKVRIGLDTRARQLSLPGFDEQGGTIPGATNAPAGDVAGNQIPPGSFGAGEESKQLALDFGKEDDRSKQEAATPPPPPPAPPKLTPQQEATRQQLTNKIREAQNYVNELASINPDDDRIPGAIQLICIDHLQLNRFDHQN